MKAWLFILGCALVAQFVLQGLQSDELRRQNTVLQRLSDESAAVKSAESRKDQDDVMRLIAAKYVPKKTEVTLPMESFPQIEQIEYPLKQGSPVYDR